MSGRGRRAWVAPVAAVCMMAAGCGPAAHRSADPQVTPQHYGGFPSWLPASTMPVGRVLAASAMRPALGIEGDTISIRIAGSEVAVTAVGPAVPEEGRFPIPATSRCTFTVTFSGATGRVPVDAGRWTVVDERGRRHPLRLQAAGPGKAPTSAAPGRTVRFDLVTRLPPGSGMLTWDPSAGVAAASWDFVVELD